MTRNLKHNCIISILYGTGVRVSELTHIKMHDIDLDRKMLRVFQGKGKKDRFVILPLKLSCNSLWVSHKNVLKLAEKVVLNSATNS